MYLSQVELDWKAWFASISESDKLNINGAALAGRISRAAVYYSSPSADATLPSPSPSPSLSPSPSSNHLSFCDRFRPASKGPSVYSGSDTVWVSIVVVLVVTAIFSYRWFFKSRTGQAPSSLDSESASENTGNISPILSSTTEVEIPPPSTQDKENLSGENSSQNNLSTTISTTSTMQGGDSVAKNEFSSAIHTTTTSVAEVAEPPPTDGSANLPEQMSPPTTTKKKKSGGKRSSKSKESGFDSPPPSGSRSGSTTSNTTPPATGSGHPQSHKHYLRSTAKKG